MNFFRTSPWSELRPIRGEGCWLRDETGARYLDLTAGTGCTVLGHGHPRFTRAIQVQLEKLVHAGPGVVTKEIQEAAVRLGGILPPGLNRVTFLNTGSEAVELALRVARVATGRRKIIGVRYGYYGATNHALALSEAGRDAAGVVSPLRLPPIPAPTCSRCPVGETYPSCGFRCLRHWQAGVNGMLEDVAAVIFEPVMGKAGVLVPPPGYLAAVAGLAREWGCLLIADEVTTGVGRTGTWTGVQHEQVEPDIVVLGKALGNGLPVAAVVSTADVEEACAGRVQHVQSHQNDPLSGAAASAVISLIEEEGLLARIREAGGYLLQQLRRLAGVHEAIGDVRGRGLMVAMELRPGGAGDQAVQVQRWLRDRRILVNFQAETGTFRFFPPYIVTRPELDLAIEALDQALSPR